MEKARRENKMASILYADCDCNYPESEREELVISNSTIITAAKKALEVIKAELPEEAQTEEGFSLIFDEMKDIVRTSRVII